MNAFNQLDWLFDLREPCLTEKGAKALAEFQSSPSDLARIEELAGRANQGTISEEERREYESWVRAGSLISVLQAKARLYLKSLRRC
jgi:hypothetical protein